MSAAFAVKQKFFINSSHKAPNMISFENALYCHLIIAAAVFHLTACQDDRFQSTSSVKVINGVSIDPSKLPGVVILSRGDHGTCTGTFLNSTTLLTAAHCVDIKSPTGNLNVDGIASVNVFIPDSYQRNPDFHGQDQAILVFPQGTGQKLGIMRYPQVSSSAASLGQDVVIAGYGTIAFDRDVGFGKLRTGSNRISFVTGDRITLEGLIMQSDQPTGRNVAASHGDSGGPLFDRSSYIIGTFSFMTVPSSRDRLKNSYVSTTTTNAKALYSQAVHCKRTPCAQNFANSSVQDVDRSQD